MEISIHYSNLVDRRAKVKEQKVKGLRMLHDTFDVDWQPGKEPHGTMIFTDVTPAESAVAEPDLVKELETLKLRVAALESKTATME